MATGDDAELARRLQILATEHWGLLAARSTAQSEVLTRISIYLTLVSAGLVTIGLLGQATRFATWFPVAALGILAFLAVIGILTLTAMNRIRGAYAEIDRTAAESFLASVHDDELGMRVTYSFLRERGSLEQVLGSSMMLSVLVTASVGGMFAGGLCAALGLPVGGAIAIGVIVGLAISGVAIAYGGRRYLTAWRTYRPLRPSGGPPEYWRARRPR